MTKHALKYPTRCCSVRFRCCGLIVYLVQRGHDTGKLTWTGVPCRCGKTYTFESDGDRSNQEVCEDVYPELAKMHCWALRSHVNSMRVVPDFETPKEEPLSEPPSSTVTIRFATETNYGVKPK